MAEENCDKHFVGDGNVYALHDYPGKSIIELSRVTAVLHSSFASTGGCDYQSGRVRIKAGSVLVNCPAAYYDHVTFVFPQ